MNAPAQMDTDDRLVAAVSRAVSILRTAVEGDGSLALIVVELESALADRMRPRMRVVR